MSKNSTFFVGLDLGDKYCYLTIVDGEGDLIEETRLRTSKSALRRKFSSLPSSRVALEVGPHSRWTSQLIEDLDHEVLVANARKLRAIYDNPRKGDRPDAETLARLARLDPKLLSPIYHRSPEAQADLAVIRSRDALVRSRTLLINHARGSAKATGVRLPSCSADSFHHKTQEAVPHSLTPALLPILDTIGSLTNQIKDHDQQVKKLCEDRYPETNLLMQISGVGPLTALTFVLTLEDPRRFKKSRQVGPALGLVPKRDQSGDKDPQLRTLVPALQVQVSQRLATLISASCSSTPPTTSWGRSAPTAICAGGGSSSWNGEASTPRREPRSPWPGSSPSSCTDSGKPGRSMTRSTNRIASPLMPLERLQRLEREHV